MWKSFDIFIFEDRRGEYLIGKIIFCPMRVTDGTVFWNVEFFASENRQGLSPLATLNYDFVKHKIRKVVNGEAEFYELFWN